MLAISLRQLQVFESVARHLNHSRAAAELYLSQPAVSMQIKQAESAIGLPLFEQVGKKLHLTVAGSELLHYARSMLQLLQEMESVFDEMKGLERGDAIVSFPWQISAAMKVAQKMPDALWRQIARRLPVKPH